MKLSSGHYQIDEPFKADINLRRLANGVRFTARWHGHVLHISVPDRASDLDLLNYLRDRREIILAKKPELTYRLDQIIDCREVDFTISAAKYIGPDRVEVRRCAQPQRGKNINYVVELGSNVVPQIGNPDVQLTINRLVLSALKQAAERFIIPQAMRCATRVGRAPRRFEIKDSKRNLGTCSSLRIITLSPRLMFLPDELREFVIYHELAHLNEMNHSHAFHSICDRYVDGNEDDLRARLKAFHFPVIF